MSRVTVIVPVYNMSEYLDKCVRSVIEQTYRDFSFIMIDDGSQDDSLDKCISWKKKDSRIIVVSKENEGLGPTRNIGVRMSSSEYITFLDSDDWWHPDYLQLMMEGAQNGKNDLVLCDLQFVKKSPCGIYENTLSTLRFNDGVLGLSNEWNLITRARTFMWGKLYRRSLFLKNDVEQPSHAYEDVATTPYLVAKAQSVFHVAHGLYYYLRNRQGSIVNNCSSLYGLLQSLEEVFVRFQKGGLLKKFSPALRQLFWGQLVFIHRNLQFRFASTDMEKREQIWTATVKTVCNFYPELESMLHWTFSVPSGDAMLKHALQLLLVDKEQLLDRSADFVIIFQGERSLFNTGKVISVHRSQYSLSDKERALWDMADEIFRALWE